MFATLYGKSATTETLLVYFSGVALRQLRGLPAIGGKAATPGGGGVAAEGFAGFGITSGEADFEAAFGLA